MSKQMASNSCIMALVYKTVDYQTGHMSGRVGSDLTLREETNIA